MTEAAPSPPVPEALSDRIVAAPIAIDESELADLRRWLGDASWPDQEPASDWSRSAPLYCVQALSDYWRTTYDWRRCEAMLNSWNPQATMLDGLEVVFVPYSVARARRAAADHDTRLARVGDRVSTSRRAADRPCRLWRRGERRLPVRCRSVWDKRRRDGTEALSDPQVAV